MAAASEEKEPRKSRGPHSAETRAKIAAGSKLAAAARAGKPRKLRGPHSAETRAKISATMKVKEGGMSPEQAAARLAMQEAWRNANRDSDGDMIPGAQKPKGPHRASTPLTSGLAKLVAKDEFLEQSWQQILLRVSEGANTRDITAEFNVTSQFLMGILKKVPEARLSWDQAKVGFLWRKWDVDTIDDILVDIANGATATKAVQDRGLPLHQFFSLVLKDPAVKDLYDDAQNIRMERMADEVLEISDDSSKDYNEYGRLDSENINRSKMKADNRKWLMGRLAWRRWGDKVQSEQNITIHVDHASRLDAARKRKEKLISGRAEPAVVSSTG